MATKIPSGRSPILIEPKSNRDEPQKLKPTPSLAPKQPKPQVTPAEKPPVLEPKIMTGPTTAPDRALDPRRSIGSGPEMNKTMPAPRNYGGIQAQPMPFIPGPNSGKAENMPFIPGKTPGKIENMPFKPESPKLKPAKPFTPPSKKMGGR